MLHEQLRQRSVQRTTVVSKAHRPGNAIMMVANGLAPKGTSTSVNTIVNLGPSTIARNTALARGRRAKQPEVGTDLPWRQAAHC